MAVKDLEKPGSPAATPAEGSLNVASEVEQIDLKVQKRAMFKFDVVVLGCLGLLYLLANLDRNNLGNSKLMGIEKDLHLVGNQFGNAVSIFYATYVTLETPYSIVLKIVGPRNLLSVCMLGWAVACIGTGFVKTANQLYACRLLLGVFEAGLIPCINTYVGMVYLKSEMSLRSAIYYAFSAIAGAFGGLLASAISNIRTERLNSWSWLFIIEGAITVVFVPLIYFAFPKDPKTAWFLNEEERHVLNLRFELNPHLGINESFSWPKIFSIFKDPKTYLHAILQFSVDISLFGFTTFLPALISGMGFANVKAQLLTVPIYVWATIVYFAIAVGSDRTGIRGPFLVGALIFLVTGYAIMLGTANVAARYVACYIMAVGIYPTTGISVVWLNSNFAGHFRRATAIGTTFTIGNIAGAVVGQIFRAGDSPRYLFGMRIAIGFSCLAIFVTCLMMAGLHWENKRREKRILARGADHVPVENGEVDDRSDDFKYNL